MSYHDYSYRIAQVARRAHDAEIAERRRVAQLRIAKRAEMQPQYAEADRLTMEDVKARGLCVAVIDAAQARTDALDAIVRNAA